MNELLIYLQTEELELVKELQNSFKSTKYHITWQSDLAPESANFIITDTRFIKKYQRHDLLRQHAHKIFLLSDESDEHNISQILEQYPICHLIGMNSGKVLHELRSNLIKEISENIWGIEQYLSPEYPCQKATVTNSKAINQIVDQLIEQFDFSDNFDSPKDYLRIMANELLTNAFYHKNTSNTDRKIDVAGTTPTIKIGRDNSIIALSVEDQSGYLNREQTILPLARAFKEKTHVNGPGGAHLGLYLTFCYANQLILNNKKNEKTEVICIIDCAKRFKKYKERITSFHYNEEKARV